GRRRIDAHSPLAVSLDVIAGHRVIRYRQTIGGIAADIDTVATIGTDHVARARAGSPDRVVRCRDEAGRYEHAAAVRQGVAVSVQADGISLHRHSGTLKAN